MHKGIVALFILAVAGALLAQTDGQVQTASVTLSAAQLQGLKGNPVVLIPAPAPGKAINPQSALLEYVAGTQRYAGGHSRFEITLGPYSTLSPFSVFDSVLTSGFTDQDADQTVTREANPVDPSLNLENQDLEIVLFGPPLIDGDGAVTVTVNYTIVSLQ